MRFPEFTDEWKQTTLGEVAERVTRKNSNNITLRPLTISAQYGLIDQRDFFDKVVASSNLEGYYLLKKGEFAYNRSSSSNYPWGAIKRLEHYNEGALSTLYICFSLKYGHPVFFSYFFETINWYNHIQSVSAEGARNHGLLNIAVSDFFTLPISLPSLPEQQKIATFLSLLDERIEAQRQIIKERKAEKKALLHQLFSQSIRFPGFSDEWKQTTLGKICQVVGGGTPSTGIDKYWGGNIPWFTPSEIQKKYIGDSERTITEEGLSNSGARLLPKGAILLTTRATVGECSISTNPCCTNQGFQSLIINPNTSTTEFIYQKVQTLRNEFLIRANGSTFKEITAQEIRGIHMFIPTLEEQSKIADFLSLLDTQIEVEEELLQKYEEQKKYLLRTMFI